MPWSMCGGASPVCAGPGEDFEIPLEFRYVTGGEDFESLYVGGWLHS